MGKTENIKRVLFTKICFCLFVSSFFFVFFFHLDGTPLRVYYDGVNLEMKAYFPQGWGFFTRNPQEEQLLFFKVGKNKTLKEVSFNMTSVENAFGLSRKVRKKNYEYSQLALKIPDKVFDSYHGKRTDLSISESKVPYLLEIDKEEYHFIEDGELLVYKYKIIPWEWSKITQIEQGSKAYIKVSHK